MRMIGHMTSHDDQLSPAGHNSDVEGRHQVKLMCLQCEVYDYNLNQLFLISYLILQLQIWAWNHLFYATILGVSRVKWSEIPCMCLCRWGRGQGVNQTTSRLQSGFLVPNKGGQFMSTTPGKCPAYCFHLSNHIWPLDSVTRTGQVFDTRHRQKRD